MSEKKLIHQLGMPAQQNGTANEVEIEEETPRTDRL